MPSPASRRSPPCTAPGSPAPEPGAAAAARAIPKTRNGKERRSLPSMAMADQIEITEMTWTEVDEAMKDRPVALLPVGATEAHGPHLPVCADTVIATEMARRG